MNIEFDALPKIMTIGQVAEYLCATESFVLGMVQRDELEVSSTDEPITVTKRSLLSWLTGGEELSIWSASDMN